MNARAQFARLLRGVLFSAAVFFSVTTASAQVPLQPSQLPSRTIFYVAWHGSPSSAERKTNALLALWDDPDFAPARSAMLQRFLSNNDRAEKSETALTREELVEYSALLDNGFVFGYLPDPHKAHAAGADKTAAPKWNGTFFLYDRTGKEALLSKAVVRFRSSEKDPPTISTVQIAGLPALKIERTTGTLYWIEHGKYAASSSERSVLEDLLTRIESKSASDSLDQSTAYQEAKPGLAGGIAEFFVRIPDSKELMEGMAATGTNTPYPMQSVYQSLKLDSVHSISGRVALDGAKTRTTGSILGVVGPGTLFDLWDEGTIAPASLAFAGPDTVAYSETRLNLPGIYGLANQVIQMYLPPQPGKPNLVEAMAQQKLGVPLQAAVDSFSGEVARIQNDRGLDPDKQLYVVGIQKQQTALDVIHHVYENQISGEHSEGNLTFMKITPVTPAPSKPDVAASKPSTSSYHLVFSPDAILISEHSETLRSLLANRAAAPGSTGLSSNPAFQSIRARYPGKIIGLSFYDFQKVDWAAAKTQWLAQAAKASDRAAGNNSSAQSPKRAMSTDAWLQEIDPKVLSRHLHTSASASWKDAKGLHLDGWID